MGLKKERKGVRMWGLYGHIWRSDLERVFCRYEFLANRILWDAAGHTELCITLYQCLRNSEITCHESGSLSLTFKTDATMIFSYTLLLRVFSPRSPHQHGACENWKLVEFPTVSLLGLCFSLLASANKHSIHLNGPFNLTMQNVLEDL